MTPEDILDFISKSSTPQTKRDIARAFKLKGSGPRTALKHILKDLEKQKAIEKLGGAYTVPQGLPGVLMVTILDLTPDGDLLATPLDWDESRGVAPIIEIRNGNKRSHELSPRDQALVRLSRHADNSYEGTVIKSLDRTRRQITGVINIYRNRIALVSSDKKDRYEYDISQENLDDAKDGDLVVAEIIPSRGMRNKQAKVTKILGTYDDPLAISLISLHEAGLSDTFPTAVERTTEGLKVPSLKGREDLRDIPLVTIDGSDAKDFDDAVFAEKTDNGFHLIVAIADVAYYVRPHAPLDIEAQKRGNSTYFPDRVVPMLPEALSNDLCSLRPNEPRACMAVHLWINDQGHLERYTFVRGLMRSHARLTYEQVQAFKDGAQHTEITKDLHTPIHTLYEAYDVLDRQRQKRGTLDLDMEEYQVILDQDGNMSGIRPRLRLDAHKLIEEFMILTNVAAAKALEAKRMPCVYRIHDRPNSDKIDSLRSFIESFDISMPKGQVTSPGQINRILHDAAQTPHKHLIHSMILRTQCQAVYSPENVGHFGLALQRYGHFTSPIRRYADLLIHRLLITAYGLGSGGISDEELSRLEEICEHISGTERTSMQAERSALDRYKAAYLAERGGAQFAGRITGVTNFGLFVLLEDVGADGLVPIRSLPDDYYVHDETAHALIGRKSGRVFQMGAPVTAEVTEADGVSGSTVLKLVDADRGAVLPGIEPPKLTRHSLKNSGGKGFRRRGPSGDKPPRKPTDKPKKKKQTTPKHKRKDKKSKPKSQ